MDYNGNDDAHGRADEIRASYIEKMKSFTRWLVDNGHRVRLFIGDTNNADESVVRGDPGRPSGAPARSRSGIWVVAEPVTTFADLMRAMAAASTRLSPLVTTT